MIVAQSGKTRRFIGSLDRGRDVIASMMEFCTENELVTAWITGTGVIRDLVLRPLTTQGFDEEPQVFEGVWFCPSINGNLSTLGSGADLRLYGVWTSTDGKSVAGLLDGGSVELFEFTAWTVEDLQIERDREDSRYARWVFMAPLNRKEVTRYETTNARNRHMPKTEDSEEELSELLVEEMRPGDVLLHPSLGRCTIVEAPKEERIIVRLESGKRVSLATKVLNVSPYRVEGGVRVFPVSIRRPS